MFGIFKNTELETSHLNGKLKRKAKREYKAYQKWLKNNNGRFTTRKIEPRYVWTDRNGRNWYVIDKLDDATVERMNAIELQLQAMQYGVSVESLSQTFTEISKVFDSLKKTTTIKTHQLKMIQTAQSKALEANHRLTQLTPDSIILELSILLHVTDGEDPYIINEALNEQKLQWIHADAETKAFFLKTSMQTFEVLTKQNDSALVKELLKNKAAGKAKV